MIKSSQVKFEELYRFWYTPQLNKDNRILPIRYINTDLSKIKFLEQRQVGYVPIFIQHNQQIVLKELIGQTIQVEGYIRIKLTPEDRPDFGLFTISNYLLLQQLQQQIVNLRAQLTALSLRK